MQQDTEGRSDILSMYWAIRFYINYAMMKDSSMI
jgi:hypothetical protein